ncbi:hypothetical protein QYM36_010512 [Artemia franciscana]|uniref:Cuticle protein n=2 Tax=Artemia franciscana TaxID=6661 RepID=A0AA88L1Z3_ARTSF|nr:hypothetical protein QYM36_010512 [Artemia franciscana]
MKTSLLALLVTAATAQYGAYYQEGESTPLRPMIQSQGSAAPAVAGYAYDYKVGDDTTGDIQAAVQKGDDKKVTGEYTVHQPDGCIRHVTYTADENGYQPTVTYSGPCDPTSYTIPAIPAEIIEIEKKNLAKAATDSALVAAEYKAVVNSQMKIVADHEKMKAEIAAAELKKQIATTASQATAYNSQTPSISYEKPASPSYIYDTAIYYGANNVLPVAPMSDKVIADESTEKPMIYGTPEMIPLYDAPEELPKTPAATKLVAQPLQMYVKRKQENQPAY